MNLGDLPPLVPSDVRFRRKSKGSRAHPFAFNQTEVARPVHLPYPSSLDHPLSVPIVFFFASPHTAHMSKASSPTFTFGSSIAPSSGSDTAFTFTSDAMRSGTGYLDDNDHASTSSSSAPQGKVTSTSLFTQLAQRQFDQQQPRTPPPQKQRRTMSQEQYDNPSSWTTSSSSNPIRPRRRRTPSSSSASSSAAYSERNDAEEQGSEYSYDSEEERRHDLALQKEWEEQVEQMKLMFQIIIFPFVGKFFGRKFGYFCKSNPPPFLFLTLLPSYRHLGPKRRRQ